MESILGILLWIGLSFLIPFSSNYTFARFKADLRSSPVCMIPLMAVYLGLGFMLYTSLVSALVERFVY